MCLKLVFSFCCVLDLLIALLNIFWQLLYLCIYLLSFGFDKNTPWYYPQNFCYGSFLVFAFIIFIILVIVDQGSKKWRLKNPPPPSPIRITHCFICKSTLKSTVNNKCFRCGWLKCKCGACGCKFKRY
jgi:hypothetical protein